MKKFFIAALALMVSSAALAGNAKNEIKNIDYSFDVKSTVVSRQLGLNAEQEDQMEYIFNRLSNDLRKVKNTKDDEKRNERMHDAIIYNLSAAHSCLSSEQYHKYLIMLNTTLSNKGLDTFFYENAMAIED